MSASIVIRALAHYHFAKNMKLFTKENLTSVSTVISALTAPQTVRHMNIYTQE